MKWFCQIFCLYLLMLSCLPCNDGEHDHGLQNGGTTTFFLSPANSSGHEHCDDTCSPLCGCQCCSVTFTLRPLAAIEFQEFAFATRRRIFPDRLSWAKEVVLAIDHPPQFV